MSKKVLRFLVLVIPILILFSCSCGSVKPQTQITNTGSILGPALSSFLKIDVDLVKRTCFPETGMCEISRSDFIVGSGFVVAKIAKHYFFVFHC